MEAISTSVTDQVTSPGPTMIPTDDQTSRDPEDVILLTVIRCIGLFYGYYQIRLLCNLGSRYTLAITSIFPLLGSLIFSSLGYLLPEEFGQIPETLLYFVLIMDLPRACFLTSIALQRSGCCKLGACSSSILQGVRILAPWLTMDTVIECIVLLLGYYSGIRRLEALCTFVCLSVLVNYVSLLAVFPLALRIVHEISSSSSKEICEVVVSNQEKLSGTTSKSPVSCLKLDQLLANWGEMARRTKPVNMNMCRSEAHLPNEVCQLIQPSSFWLRGKILAAVVLALAYVFGWISISVDQLVVLSVAAALTIRYLFFEEKADNFRTVSEESTVTTTTTTVNTIYVDSGASNNSSSNQNTTAASAAAVSSPNNNLGNPAVVASSSSVPIAITAPPPPKPPTIISTPFKPSSQRVRKMPVNAKEVEILLSQNGLGEGIKPTVAYRETCSSPDSGISKSDSGSATPITFSIGDHSESDDDSEGDSSELSLKMQNGGGSPPQSMMENMEIGEHDGEEHSYRWSGPPRSLEECLSLYKTDDGVKQLSDEEIINLVNAKYIPPYQLEKAVQDLERGVAIRRKISCMQKDIKGPTPDIPYKHYDYTLVQGACCENVVGYVPVPLGIAGPLKMDGQSYYVPMATTEGCLVASTNRGCRAFVNGVRSRVVNEGMSRAPVVRFPDSIRAAEAMIWLNDPENFQEIKQTFDASSRFARLVKIHPRIAGRYLFIRFVAKTGDAMGMNMISKGTEMALQAMSNQFNDMEVLALSGNVCTDKKPAAINWLEGRGKSVVAEAIVPAEIVETVLKTTTAALVELNIAKNLIGSATAGSIGGFNAHAANIVTAIYIACGQDPAQNVASSNCMTIMEPSGPDGRDLFISCTMPSIECGTIGGGTILPAQAGCLEMLGIRGANDINPGENARTFARLVSAAVLAGELSLMAALAAGHLVKSHLKHNRSATLLTAIAIEQKPSSENATSSSTHLSAYSSPRTLGTPIARNGNLCTSSSDISSKPISVNSHVSFDNNNTNGLGHYNPLVHKQEELVVKNNLNNSKSSPVITTMDFLSVPDCKQT